MVSTRSMRWPFGYAGLPSVQGSIRITSPETRRNWNVPCPSQVISIPGLCHDAAMPAAGKRALLALLRQQRGSASKLLGGNVLDVRGHVPLVAAGVFHS